MARRYGTYGASIFGGPNDPGTGHIGYKGDDLRKKPDSFAELGKDGAIGNAMGGLKYGTRARFTFPDGTVKILRKRDVGRGGGPVNGHHRSFDIWYQSAPSGFSLGKVKVEILDGKSKGRKYSTNVGGQAPASGGRDYSGVLQEILRPGKLDANRLAQAVLSAPQRESVPMPDADVGAPPASAGPSVRVGGSSPKRAVQNITHGIGMSGITMTSGKRNTVNTASGNVSDHYIGNKSAHAEDYAGSQKAMDSFARRAARALGIKNYKPGQIYNVNKNGYRYQLIWGTSDHRDHVHLGAKKL